MATDQYVPPTRPERPFREGSALSGSLGLM
jgi:hypothetical protein